MRCTVRCALMVALVAVSLAGVAQPAGAQSRPRGAAGQSPAAGQSGAVADVGGGRGVGADVPFVEYQAEDAATTGSVIGPDWAYGTLPAEAVGRRAVKLDARGQYVEFRLTRAANAVDVRYSIPDSSDGTGLDATLGIYVNGQFTKSLSLTSRYSWYYGQYPWTNNPADGGRRDLYDDARLMFGSTLPAGTQVRLQVGAGDTAPWYVIDLADFEQVAAPAPEPRGALSVVDFGADPTGTADSTQAIQRAIDAASGKGVTVWIPPGTFTVTRHLIVDKVSMRGAGPWYSVLHGAGVGVYGNYAPTPSSDVHLADFAIFGEVTERNDAAQVNGVGGSLAHSTIDNLWIQHTKVGAWLDGPFDGLTISHLRILDLTADGINFHDGITHSTVTDTYVRGTGDDGLAMWSEHHADAANVFAHNTVEVPTLANNIALYGGSDNTVSDNLVADTLVQGGGIHVGNRFGAVPLAGTTTIAHNALVRTGTLDLFSHIGEGALWFWAADAPLDGAVNVSDNRIDDSAYEAIQFLGSSVTNVHVDHDIIDKTGTFAVQLNAPGSATFSDVIAARLGAGGRYDCNAGFTITAGAGNCGWSDTHCGYPPPGPLTLTSQDQTLQFVTDAIGKPSDPQTVTVTNPSSQPMRIASVSTTGAFTLSTTCGDVLAPGASCTVEIRFVPTPRGDRGGSLTVSDGTPAGRYQVHVQGQVIASTVGNLAAGRPVTASSELAAFPAANAVDANTDTYWESLPLTSPQNITVDLGSAVTVSRVTLKLNGGWGGRTQRLEILASSDGTTFTTVVPAADYAFDPSTNNNTVEIRFPAIQQRYIRVQATSNTGAPGAQIAEFEVYGNAPTATTTPGGPTATSTAVPSVTGTTAPSATSTGTTAPSATSTGTTAPSATGTTAPTMTSTAVPPTSTSTTGPPTATSTPTAPPVCQLFALPAFATVPRGGEQALLVDAAPNSAMTLTIKAGYPAQATLYTDSSLGSSDGFGVTLTGARASGGYRYTFHVEASGLALLTFAIPRAARMGTVVTQVMAQEPCGLFKTVTTFQVRGRVTGAGAATRSAGRTVTLAITLPHGAALPANAAQLARRGVLRVTTQGRGATARRVLRITYHPHPRPAPVKAGAAHPRPHTLFGVAIGTGTESASS